MKLIIMTIVFSSLVLYKGYDGEEANIVGEGDKNLPSLEENKLLQFPKQVFCWPSAVFWIAKSPWGYYVAGLAGLLLWLMVEVWSKSCLAILQNKRSSRATAPLEMETEPEMDLELPKQTHRSLCACGTQTADLERYKPPRETYGPPFKTCRDLGRLHQHEMALYFDSWRRRPPASYYEPNLKNFSSSSYTSSSSSSLGSSLCLAHLKHLDLRCMLESPPALSDSAEAILGCPPSDEPEPSIFLERTDSVSCLDVGDSSAIDGPSAIEENADNASMSVLMFAERMETLSPFPEENGSQPLASFAQINILQSLRKDDNVVFVGKSLAICMGKVPAPLPPPAVQEEEEEEEEGKEEEEEPTKISFEDQKPCQHMDKNIGPKHSQSDSLQELFFTVRRTILRAPSEAKPCARLDTDFTSVPFKTDLLPLSYNLENMGGEARHFLEFHIKKKMIQKQFGIPTAVTKSLRAFHHALVSPSSEELVASVRQTSRSKCVRTDTRRPLLLVSPHRKPAARAANLVRKIPGKKEYSIINSIDPEEIQRLAFHARVKMLEIKMGAFPDTVEKSFFIFKILSEKPLPKCIHFGNKIQRSKQPSLSFLADEALCIIDLNIKQKCLVGTRKLSALDMKTIWEELRDQKRDAMERLLKELYRATSVPEMCLERAEPSLGELRRTALEVLEPQAQPGSFSGLGLTMTALSFSKPSRPEDHTINPFLKRSRKQAISRQVQFQESVILDYKKQVPHLGLRTPAPESRGSSYPIPSQPGSSSGLGMTMTALSSSKRSGSEDHTTSPFLEGSRKQSISRQVQFQESVLDYKKQVPHLVLRTPAPETQGPSYPIPSPMTTTTSSSSSPMATTTSSSSGSSSSTMNSSSSKPRWPEDGTTKGMPKKPHVPWMWNYQQGPRVFDAEARRETSQSPDMPQEAHLHKVEPCPKEKVSHPGLGEQPIAPLSQESSHLLCSQLVTKTSSSFDPRGSADDDTTKGLSKICVSREMLFREISILETFCKEKSRESLREPSKHPDSQAPSASLSSALVNARKLSEAYLKYVTSGHSACSVAQKPSQIPSQQKFLGTSAKDGSGPRRKGIRTEKVAGVGGKGIEMAGEAKADGKGAKPETGREKVEANSCQEEDDGPIKRTSIFLELELKKQKLNLLLKKRLQAHLQPPQRAAIELTVDVDKEPDSRKAKKAAYQPGSSDTEARGKRRRPFCYVCMPVDNTGSVVKTVCWSLPKWILEMNGNRVPQVARFEKRPKGPTPAAK